MTHRRDEGLVVAIDRPLRYPAVMGREQLTKAAGYLIQRLPSAAALLAAAAGVKRFKGAPFHAPLRRPDETAAVPIGAE